MKEIKFQFCYMNVLFKKAAQEYIQPSVRARVQHIYTTRDCHLEDKSLQTP
jgi:hypothetical protein